MDRVIAWGLIWTAVGLASVPQASAVTQGMQPQDVVFLIAGGLLTCLIGAVGLAGFMGWIPGLRAEQQNCS